MKRTDKTNETGKKKRSDAPVIIVLLLLILLLIFLLVRCSDRTVEDEAKQTEASEPAGELWDGSTPTTSKTSEEKTINATIYPLAYVTEKEPEYPVYNDASNEVTMVYIFSLDGEELCRSKEIYPGYMDRVDLYEALEKNGTYNLELSVETKSVYDQSECNGIHTSIELTRY